MILKSLLQRGRTQDYSQDLAAYLIQLLKSDNFSLRYLASEALAQSGNEAALFINKNYPHEPIVSMSIYAPALEFYLQDSVIITDTSSISSQNHQSNRIWFVTEDELNLLRQKGIEFKILKEFPHFYVTRLSLKFLNKKTRQQELTSRFLVKFI